MISESQSYGSFNSVHVQFTSNFGYNFYVKVGKKALISGKCSKVGTNVTIYITMTVMPTISLFIIFLNYLIDYRMLYYGKK